MSQSDMTLALRVSGGAKVRRQLLEIGLAAAWTFLDRHQRGRVLDAMATAIIDGRAAIQVTGLADEPWRFPNSLPSLIRDLATALGMPIGAFRRGHFVHLITERRRLRRMTANHTNLPDLERTPDGH